MTVKPMLVEPAGTLGSDVTTKRNCAVAPEPTPDTLVGCTWVGKNMNESGVKNSCAGPQAALFVLRAVTK